MLDKNAIGRSSPPTLNEVEKGAIRRFAEALGDFNPMYYDEEYARAAGYPTIVAPPTFPASFHSAADLRELLGVGIKSLLHAEQAFEYERPIFAGDRIYVATRVAEVLERTGPAGKMDVAVIEDEGRDEEGNLVFKARRTLVVRASQGELGDDGLAQALLRSSARGRGAPRAGQGPGRSRAARPLRRRLRGLQPGARRRDLRQGTGHAVGVRARGC